jgi:predicted AlkP superfamily phosphohydrolase/phosphomutase
MIFEPDTYRCPTVGAAAIAPFYALGTEHKVIALDVPHVRPHQGVEGLQVIGWGAHDPQFPPCSVPSGLLREIEVIAGQHRAGEVEYSGSWNQPRYLECLARVVIDGARRRGAVVRLLVERCPEWALLLVGISDGHQPGHQMWHGVDDRSPLSDASTAPIARECLVAIHRAIDASIGDILEAAGDATVVVFSLKGMEPADAEVAAPLLIPELLHRLHFGRPFVPSPVGVMGIPPPLVPRTDSRPEWPAWQALDTARLLRFSLFGRSVARAKRFLRRRLRGQQRSRDVSARMAAEQLHEPVDALSLEPVISSVDWWHPACCYREHWPKMRAFVIPSYSDVHLRINLAGREREGLVPAGDYEVACDEVERELRACQDARTGRPVFGKITRMRSAEPLAARGPGADIVAQCAGPTDVLDHPTIGRLGPFPYLRTGTHSSEGFAWVAGDGIRPGDAGEFPALDLPPTLLELLAARPPHRLDGEAIRGLLPGLVPTAG